MSTYHGSVLPVHELAKKHSAFAVPTDTECTRFYGENKCIQYHARALGNYKEKYRNILEKVTLLAVQKVMLNN